MSKYRILEVEGEYICCAEGGCPDCTKKYTPKFIVQEYNPTYDAYRSGIKLKDYHDLMDFENLDKARAYKRSLELKNGGIVIE